MKQGAILLALVLLFVVGCDDHFHTLWHGQTLPSGSMVKVISFNLVWGIEHDDRDVSKDSFAIEYVTAFPGADVKIREAEAAEVWELVRPVSEQWGFRTASMAAFPTLNRRGRYDIYACERQADGKWTVTRGEMKVFASD